MIEIRDFTFRYREGNEPVVKDINLTIPAGAFVGITGAAGSGKSTLTYAMIVLGTATFNAVFNTILVPLMRKVLKR